MQTVVLINGMKILFLFRSHNIHEKIPSSPHLAMFVFQRGKGGRVSTNNEASLRMLSSPKIFCKLCCTKFCKSADFSHVIDASCDNAPG